MTNPDATFDVSETEWVRNYDPKVVSWKLTALGLSRFDNGLLPPQLPVRAPGMIRLLKRLDIAEEDELADFMRLSLTTVRSLLKRLMGYGYAVQVT